MLVQYCKDFSFENPNAPNSLMQQQQQPQISIQINVNPNQLSNTDFEVELKIEGKAELTGTGDGRLFAFFTTTPVYVAQVDKTNGGTMNPVPMTGVQTPQDWAFSFWGGHFYLYTSQGMLGTGGSDVTDYDPTSGTINTTYMTKVGFDIVGAGVSTCAPTVAPQ